MDAILNLPGQALGKGYYVSLHPVDSRIFGDRLNILKMDKTLNVVESATPKDFADDGAIVEELRGLGLDMVSASRYANWYSMISEKNLADVQDLSEASFRYILDHFRDEYNIAQEMPEGDFKVIWKEKRSAFADTQFARDVLARVRGSQPLSPTEQEMYRLLQL
jgi:hypothetical protein